VANGGITAEERSSLDRLCEVDRLHVKRVGSIVSKILEAYPLQQLIDSVAQLEGRLQGERHHFGGIVFGAGIPVLQDRTAHWVFDSDDILQSHHR